MSWGHFAVLILDWGKDLIFQYQKSKIPWGWGCTYSNIFGFSILACRSSFIRFFFCFSCIGLTLFKNNCSNETFVGADSIRLSLEAVLKPAESKQNVVRIRGQYYLVIVMGIICVGNCFTKLWSTKFVQQNFLLTSYSFTKVWIPQSYFYLIIRFLSPYQNSYFTKLQVTLNFSDKLHILNTNNIVKSPTLILNNSKIRYKDTIQVCFTSL